MQQSIQRIALLVNDYDEAISYYTGKLNFVLLEDTPVNENKRWVVVAPPGSGSCALLLAKAANDHQRSRIGDQTGGRVFLFLYTDDIERDYKQMKGKGISFTREPVDESWGRVAVFEDLYGNLWDLIQPLEKNILRISGSEF
jgi:catechol 2,3-dioxygenase-like lactoylglutathione lyase family enzyme